MIILFALSFFENKHKHLISIISRRTADVRSVGYSELFSLSREDVLTAMKDYPEAQVSILLHYPESQVSIVVD